MSKELHEVLRCEVCGNIVEVIHVGVAQIQCCGKPMTIVTSPAKDIVNEKHIPEIKKVKDGIEVQVGKVLHPATVEHYIDWVELIANGKSYRQFITPGDEPRVVIHTDVEHGLVRIYCNIHGMWQAEF